MVDEVALGWFFLRILRFPRVSIIQPLVHFHSYHLGGWSVFQGFLFSSSVPPDKYRNSAFKLGHCRFLPHACQIMIDLFFHSTLCSMSYYVLKLTAHTQWTLWKSSSILEVPNILLLAPPFKMFHKSSTPCTRINSNKHI
jgi:hypothetical protein